MNDTVRLGRVAGIPVGINWTWLLVFVLFSVTLASSVFPAANPGLGAVTYAVMGVAAVLLFFASLLLHELGHALQARREGVRIEGITLWLLGGVARFRGAFPNAGAEFRIAIAGPAVTAVLGSVFVGLAMLTHFAAALDGVLAWLGYINSVLLAFNLLPALPLDGGRVFRATLWQLKDRRALAGRGTRHAADPPVHGGAAVGGAGSGCGRPRAPPQQGASPRRRAEPCQTAAGVPFPHPLSLRHRDLPESGAPIGQLWERAPRGLSPPATRQAARTTPGSSDCR